MTTLVDLSRSGSTAHNAVGDNQPAYVTTIVLRLTEGPTPHFTEKTSVAQRHP